MAERKHFYSGTKWEKQIGYSRAVRTGNIINVSGTASVENDKIVGPNDPYLQTKTIIGKINTALNKLGAKLEDVVRVRIYVTKISYWDEASKAYTEAFGNIKPAATLVEVNALINPELLVEIEADAIVDE